MGRRDPTSYHGSWTNPVDTLREHIHSYRDMNTVISALRRHPNRSNKHCWTLKYGEAQASANFSQNGYGALYNYGLMSGEYLKFPPSPAKFYEFSTKNDIFCGSGVWRPGKWSAGDWEGPTLDTWCPSQLSYVLHGTTPFFRSVFRTVLGVSGNTGLLASNAPMKTRILFSSVIVISWQISYTATASPPNGDFDWWVAALSALFSKLGSMECNKPDTQRKAKLT